MVVWSPQWGPLEPRAPPSARSVSASAGGCIDPSRAKTAGGRPRQAFGQAFGQPPQQPLQQMQLSGASPPPEIDVDGTEEQEQGGTTVRRPNTAPASTGSGAWLEMLGTKAQQRPVARVLRLPVGLADIVTELSEPCAVWQPRRWLEARALAASHAAGLGRLLQCVRQSTERAVQKEGYELEARIPSRPSSPKAVPATVAATMHVNLGASLVGVPKVHWLNQKNVDVPVGLDNLEAGSMAPPLIVCDASPLDLVASLRKELGKRWPIALVTELTAFDETGGIDLVRQVSTNRDHLSLRSDFGRYLQEAATPLKSSGESLRSHLCDPGEPRVTLCPGVTVFRGSRDNGFPFLDQPHKAHVVATALPMHRPVMQNVLDRGRCMDWYAQRSDHRSLLWRYELVGLAALQAQRVAPEEQGEGGLAASARGGASGSAADELLPPVLIMPALGCGGDGRHPRDATAAILKQWRRRFAANFRTVFVCCGSRLGGEPDLPGYLDAIINKNLYRIAQEERPILQRKLAGKVCPWHWQPHDIAWSSSAGDMATLAGLCRKSNPVARAMTPKASTTKPRGLSVDGGGPRSASISGAAASGGPPSVSSLLGDDDSGVAERQDSTSSMHEDSEGEVPNDAANGQYRRKTEVKQQEVAQHLLPTVGTVQLSHLRNDVGVRGAAKKATLLGPETTAALASGLMRLMRFDKNSSGGGDSRPTTPNPTPTGAGFASGGGAFGRTKSEPASAHPPAADSTMESPRRQVDRRRTTLQDLKRAAGPESCRTPRTPGSVSEGIKQLSSQYCIDLVSMQTPKQDEDSDTDPEQEAEAMITSYIDGSDDSYHAIIGVRAALKQVSHGGTALPSNLEVDPGSSDLVVGVSARPSLKKKPPPSPHGAATAAAPNGAHHNRAPMPAEMHDKIKSRAGQEAAMRQRRVEAPEAPVPPSAAEVMMLRPRRSSRGNPVADAESEAADAAALFARARASRVGA